jgi:exonuclease III
MPTKAKTNTRRKTYTPVQKPTKLKDLTTRDYLRFMDLAVKYDESTSPNKDLELITAYFDVDFSDMPLDIAEAFVSEWLKDMTDTEWLNSMDAVSAPKSFKLKGMNFTVPQDITKATSAQYADYLKYIQTYEGHPYGFWPIAMAIFCQKQGQRYDNMNILDRIETMKDCNLVTSAKVCAFFLIQSERYRQITHLWLSRFQETPKPHTLQSV